MYLSKANSKLTEGHFIPQPPPGQIGKGCYINGPSDLTNLVKIQRFASAKNILCGKTC